MKCARCGDPCRGTICRDCMDVDVAVAEGGILAVLEDEDDTEPRCANCGCRTSGRYSLCRSCDRELNAL